jgi:hypothetical protein
MTGYIHCFLRCPNMHAISLPIPSLIERDGSPRWSAKEARIAVFVCPECGLGSLYSSQDIQELVIADRPSLFQRGECLLISVRVECDGNNCEASKVIYTLQGVDTGNWRPRTALKDWKFSDNALCAAGHKLCFDPAEDYEITPAEMPL